MSLHDDLFDFIQDFSLWDRSGWQYLIAIGTFLGLFLLLYIIRFSVLNRVEKYLEQRESMDRVEILLEGVNKVLSRRIIFLLSLYVGIQTLNPSNYITEPLRLLVLFGVTYFLIRFSFVLVDYLIEFRAKYAESDSTNILHFFRLTLKTVMVVIIGLWFLTSLGIQTDVFIGSLGVFALAIAFALQNVIADVFASLTIYLDKPIEIGDTIVIGGEMGTVEKIGIRSTRLRTLAGHMLIVSNREIINARIHNYQKMERRRVPFTVGVHFSTSPETLREMPALMEEIITSVPNTKFDRAFLNNIGTVSYDFEVVYFVQNRSYSKYLRTHQLVTTKIIETFAERGIEIPYPTQTLLVDKSSEVN